MLCVQVYKLIRVSPKAVNVLRSVKVTPRGKPSKHWGVAKAVIVLHKSGQ